MTPVDGLCRTVAVPDTDGELTMWLDRLEELLISVTPLPGDPDDWEFPGPPFGDGAALDALGRLAAAVRTAEGRTAPVLVAPDARVELVPIRFLSVRPDDLAVVAQAVRALDHAATGHGDDLVASALADHAARHRLTGAELVDGFSRSQLLLAVPPSPDVSRPAALLTRSEDRVRLGEADAAAYERVTDQHLVAFYHHEPLARFLFRGGPGRSR